MAEQVSSLRTGIKYKDTPIGKIPVDWEVKTLIDTASNEKYSFTGGPFGSDLKENSYTDHGVRVIQLQNIGDGKFFDEYKIFTSEEKANQLKNCNIYPGDIIIAKMADPVARACIIPDVDKRYLMASDGIRLSVNKEKYDLKFMLYAINSPNFRRNAESHSTGSTRLRIGLTELKNLLIAIPPLKDQKKIADILKTVDEAIEKADQIIEKTKEVKKALMQKLLTIGIGHKKFKKTEIGEIPEEWKTELLGDIVFIKHGFAFKSEYFSDAGPVLLTPGNFKEEGGLYFNEGNLKRYSGKYPGEFSLSPNDLVIVMTDLSPFCKILGNPAFIPSNETVLHNQRIGKVVFNGDRINRKFLYFYFLSKQFKQEIKATATGSTVRHTAPERIHGIKLALPPIREQKQIAEILSSIDGEIEKESNHKDQLEALKKGLMQVLLTGKIRVVV
jgi:type I restriction enzyme, S subunit